MMTNGGGSGLKFFKIILFEHGPTALGSALWHWRLGGRKDTQHVKNFSLIKVKKVKVGFLYSS